MTDQTKAALERYDETQEMVLEAASRLQSAWREDQERPHANSAAEVEYAMELLALASRELARAVDTLPATYQPVGWTKKDEL